MKRKIKFDSWSAEYRVSEFKIESTTVLDGRGEITGVENRDDGNAMPATVRRRAHRRKIRATKTALHARIAEKKG